jgi:hypothetical protein
MTLSKVQVISAYCKGGGIDLEVGTVLVIGQDITAYEARVKIAQGFVAPVTEEASAESPAPDDETEVMKGKGSKGKGK